MLLLSRMRSAGH